MQKIRESFLKKFAQKTLFQKNAFLKGRFLKRTDSEEAEVKKV